MDQRKLRIEKKHKPINVGIALEQLAGQINSGALA